MKPLLNITTFALCLLTMSSFAQKIKGSETVFPLCQKEADNYKKANKDANLTVTGSGTTAGFAALADGSSDISMASRKIKENEQMKLKEGGKSFKEVPIAYDALAVVVNTNNKISKLTREQLVSIFIGQIKNWKELGGDDMAIVVYARESSSPSEFFKEHVLENKNCAETVKNKSNNDAIIQAVGQDKGSIGYVGISNLSKAVKPVEISFDGKTFTSPNVENVKNKTYPISRSLYFYYLDTKEKMVKSFIDYVLTSPESQKVIKEEGFVPLK